MVDFDFDFDQYDGLEEDQEPSPLDHIIMEDSSKSNLNWSKTRKTSAWTDPDDAALQVSLASDNRLRKLREGPEENSVGGREYERRLRKHYEKINPTPEWASNARKKATKRKRRSDSSSGHEEEEFVHLLSSTNGLLVDSNSTKRPRLLPLPHGTLSIERLRDANQGAPSEGEIKAVRFHPSSNVPVLMTAGVDRRVRLFNVCSFLSLSRSFNQDSLLRCRSMVTQIPISKPFIFPLSLSQPPNSTRQDHPSSSPVVDRSTTPTISNPALPINHHAVFGARRSTTRTHKLKIRVWRSAHSTLVAKCSPSLVGGATSIW